MQPINVFLIYTINQFRLGLNHNILVTEYHLLKSQTVLIVPCQRLYPPSPPRVALWTT